MKTWDEIIEKCPNLFKNYVHFECGLGWADIIHDLCLKLEKILDKHPENEMYVVQIKQKYGTLRFYMETETDEISQLIHEAEVLSSQTCEGCGSPGKMR